jgi:hypothetical protein
VFNAKIVVGGRVTGIHWIADTRRVRVWIQIHTHKRLWVRIWVEFCLAGMDSRTIYPCTTRPIAIPNGGREMAREIIQKSEKGIHDARKVAEAAEKTAEPEGQIGIN